MLGTVRRAGDVLDLFTLHEPEWGATAVARELEIAKSQAHAMLVSLASIGLLRRTEAARYRLGWRALSLGADVLNGAAYVPTARRIMRSLAAAFPEVGVHLAVWDRGTVICIARTVGSKTSAEVGQCPFPTTGSSMVPHRTSAGKVLLATQCTEEHATYLREQAYAEDSAGATLCSGRFYAELAEARERGFAEGPCAHHLAVHTVAAAIGLTPGETVASIGMSIPTERWGCRSPEYTRAAVAGAEMISRQALRTSASRTGHVVAPRSVPILSAA